MEWTSIVWGSDQVIIVTLLIGDLFGWFTCECGLWEDKWIYMRTYPVRTHGRTERRMDVWLLHLYIHRLLWMLIITVKVVAILFATLCIVTLHVTSVESYGGLLQVTYFYLKCSALPRSSIFQAQSHLFVRHWNRMKWMMEIMIISTSVLRMKEMKSRTHEMSWKRASWKLFTEERGKSDWSKNLLYREVVGFVNAFERGGIPAEYWLYTAYIATVLL
jgi:hypothetical protein